MADESDPVTFAQVQVDVLQRFDDYDVVLIAPDCSAGCAEEGFLHGAGFGVEDGEVDAGVVCIDGYHVVLLIPSS